MNIRAQLTAEQNTLIMAAFAEGGLEMPAGAYVNSTGWERSDRSMSCYAEYIGPDFEGKIVTKGHRAAQIWGDVRTRLDQLERDEMDRAARDGIPTVGR